MAVRVRAAGAGSRVCGSSESGPPELRGGVAGPGPGLARLDVGRWRGGRGNRSSLIGLLHPGNRIAPGLARGDEEHLRWPAVLERRVVTLLLRERVDAHRVQRLLRHRDVKTTTGTYGHLVVEDLREAINLLPPAPFAASLLQGPGPTSAGVQDSMIDFSENQQLGLERETGVEPATLSLGS